MVSSTTRQWLTGILPHSHIDKTVEQSDGNDGCLTLSVYHVEGLKRQWWIDAYNEMH